MIPHDWRAVLPVEKVWGFRRTRKVMSPQRSNFVLSAHIPDIELDILIRDRFDVEADCWDGGDVLIELEFVEDC